MAPIYAHGNLWTYDAEVVVITTNGYVTKAGACVMGRGCALEAKTNFPGIELKLGAYIQQYGNRAFHLGRWTGGEGDAEWTFRIVSLPTKHKWNQNSDPGLIAAGLHQLMAMADKFKWQHIVMPPPGTGNGHLPLADVLPLLDAVLDDRFTVLLPNSVRCANGTYDWPGVKAKTEAQEV